MSVVVGVMVLLMCLLIAGYGTRWWLTSLLWLDLSLVLTAFTVSTIAWIAFRVYTMQLVVTYLGAGLFLAGWGVGGFVDAREADRLDPFRNWWVSLVVGLLGVVLICGALALLVHSVPFYPYD